MALGTTNINTTNVSAELGITAQRAISLLVKTSTISAYSFYSPGVLSVDTNSDIVWSADTTSYKLGDFRSYNHSANTPSSPSDFTQNWGPGGSTVDFTMAWFPEQLSIWEFAIPADYITIKFYWSTTDRTNEANSIKTVISSLSFSTITPLVGHSRTTTKRISSTQLVSVNLFPTTGLTTPDDFVYADTYMSDVAGNRKINLPDSGYTTLTFHEKQNPYARATGNISSPPSGYTAAFIELHTASTNCTATAQVAHTAGSSSYAFYVGVRGIYSSEERMMQITSCDITLTINGVAQTVLSAGSLSQTAKTSISGTLSNSRVWSYDDIGDVTISNVTFGTGYTTC